MAWVVKAWKPEPLQAAEREARRLRRAAGREAADAAAYLVALEDLAAELREGIRRRRRGQAPEPLPIPEKRPASAPAQEAAPTPTPEPEPQPQPGEIRATQAWPGRASMRDSPLSDLFRSTG